MDADYGGNETVKVSRNCTFQVLRKEFITIHFFWVKKNCLNCVKWDGIGNGHLGVRFFFNFIYEYLCKFYKISFVTILQESYI
jgi:hypothetical protein